MLHDRTPDRPPWALARARLGLPILAVLLGLARPAGAQTDTQRAAARSAAQAGDKAFKEQRYDDAAVYFARAETIMHAPTLLLFLARSQAKLGEYVKARESYIKILREQLAPDAPAAFVAAKQSARDELPQVEQQIATLTLDVPGVPLESLRITIDDEQVSSAIVGVPYPMDPGEHRVDGRALGYEAAEASLKLTAGAARELTLTLTPISAGTAAETRTAQPPPRGGDRAAAAAAGADGSGMLMGGYVSLGVGVVGIGLGTLFAVQHLEAKSAANETWAECLEKSEDGCEDRELERRTHDLDDEAATHGTQAWIAYGVGAAGLATGIALLALRATDSRNGDLRNGDSPSLVRVTPYVTRNGCGVAGQF